MLMKHLLIKNVHFAYVQTLRTPYILADKERTNK